MKYAQLVLGPAGSGKTTYCRMIGQHCEALGRRMSLVNIDPAAEERESDVFSVDIRNLISLTDVMEELGLGPNGGLVYCMEYLMQNPEWFAERVGDFDEDYLIIDCPGQIELYTHLPAMKDFVKFLVESGYTVCAIFLLDAQFLVDPSKFVSGSLAALSVMMHLGLPHLNVLSKMDLVRAGSGFEGVDWLGEVDDLVELDVVALSERLPVQSAPHLQRLSDALLAVLQDHSMVSFVPLDISDDESLDSVLLRLDMILQFGEDAEPKIPRDPDDLDETE